MQQPLPVVRQLNPKELIPQFLAIAVLCAIAWLFLPNGDRRYCFFVGPIAYLVFCRVMRWLFVRDHTRGMEAYRAGKFEDAIVYFEASHRFFSTHRRLDLFRSLLFGVASYNPYRVIALGNMAYCYGQLGNGEKAIELYELVLREIPDHAVAKSSLNLLRSAPPRTDAA